MIILIDAPKISFKLFLWFISGFKKSLCLVNYDPKDFLNMLSLINLKKAFGLIL